MAELRLPVSVPGEFVERDVPEHVVLHENAAARPLRHRGHFAARTNGNRLQRRLVPEGRRRVSRILAPSKGTLDPLAGEADGIQPSIAVQVDEGRPRPDADIDGLGRHERPASWVGVPDELAIDDQVNNSVLIEIHGT